jgi:hypothetical protein
VEHSGRWERAVSAAAIEVLEVRRIENAGNLKASAKIKVGCILLHGLKVIQQPGQKPWVALPQQAARAKADGSGSSWFPVVEITNRGVLDRIREAVLSAWQEREAAGRTAVHRVAKPSDPRQDHIDELAAAFDRRPADKVPF